MVDARPFKRRHLLLTGLPGCGKSTVLIRLADRLVGHCVRGFTTGEVREGGTRVGFKIRTLSGREGFLSHVRFGSRYRVGKYGVDVGRFEELVLPELAPGDSSVEIFLIDEIGKMECFSTRFVNAVRDLLDGTVPVVATVAARGGGFINDVKNRPDIHLLQVTPRNRDRLPERIAEWFARPDDPRIGIDFAQ